MSSAGIPLRQRSPHIDIVHLYKARGIENRHSAPCWHWSQNLGYWMSMPKLNAPAEIHWRRSNMNTRDPILMKSVEVLKDCRSSNAAAEMNCPMPRSVEKVPIRNEKRCMQEDWTANFLLEPFSAPSIVYLIIDHRWYVSVMVTITTVSFYSREDICLKLVPEYASDQIGLPSSLRLQRLPSKGTTSHFFALTHYCDIFSKLNMIFLFHTTFTGLNLTENEFLYENITWSGS